MNRFSTLYNNKGKLLLLLSLLMVLNVKAQVGEHRNEFTMGVHGGIVLNTLDFMPTVNQNMYTGKEAGVMFRYTCEKYFNTICSIQAEINYAQLGWKEELLDANDNPVPSYNAATGKFDGEPESYKRQINYIQVPILAHLAWGKEKKGVNFFFNAGPQFGYYLSESTETNVDMEHINPSRVNKTKAQYSMEVENKIDYGIAAGLGVELHIQHVGRFHLEGRYYYGLGNIYGDSKRDFFGKSSNQTITARIGYCF